MKTVLSAGSNRQHPEKSRNFCITENGIRSEEGVSLALDEEDEEDELEDEELELELLDEDEEEDELLEEVEDEEADVELVLWEVDVGWLAAELPG